MKPSGAQNGLVGDGFSLDLPVTQMEEDVLAEEKKRARFSRTAEFQALKKHLESRIERYREYLPDGREITATADTDHLGKMWLVANAVIGEFNAVLVAYESARAAVEAAKEAEKKKNV